MEKANGVGRTECGMWVVGEAGRVMEKMGTTINEQQYK